MNPATSAAPVPTRRRPGALRRALRVFVGAFLVLGSLGTAWAFASPVMAVPDEPAHAIHAAAVVRGQVPGEPTGEGGWTDVVVPEYVADSYEVRCFAFDPAVSGECQQDISTDDAPTEVTTSAGSYDPLYYAVVGLPSLVLEGESSFYGMRIAGVLLCSAFLALSLVALDQLRRRFFAVAAFVLSATPMLFFLVAGINPNGLEVVSCVMLFSWLALLVERLDEGVPAHRVAMVVVAAVTVANTRSIGLLWLLVVVVALLADRKVLPVLLRSVAFWVGTAVIGLGAAFSVLWVLSTASLSVTVPNPGVGTPFPQAFRLMLAATFDNFQGYVGLFGWLDTPVPQTVVSVWTSVILAAVVAGLVFGRAWSRRALAIVLVAFVLVPPLVQGSTAVDYGFIWQARYILALLCTVVVAAGIALDHAFPEAVRQVRVRRLVALVLGTLVVLQVYAFLWNLRRYVVGLPDGWSKMIVAPEWQPPGSWVLWAAIAAVVTAAGTVAAHRLGTSEPLVSARTPPRSHEVTSVSDQDHLAQEPEEAPAQQRTRP